METSVLEKEYVEPDRPCSQKELDTLRKRMLKKLYIGNVLISHEDCGHFYYAKSGGKKEREFNESKGQNKGNCSVCWKINRTPKRLRHIAENLVDMYCHTLPERLDPPSSYYYLDMETCYYTWLYTEFNETQVRPVQK